MVKGLEANCVAKFKNKPLFMPLKCSHVFNNLSMGERFSVGTAPTDKMHPVGTFIFLKSICISLNFDCIIKINDRMWHPFFNSSLLSLR